MKKIILALLLSLALYGCDNAVGTSEPNDLIMSSSSSSDVTDTPSYIGVNLVELYNNVDSVVKMDGTDSLIISTRVGDKDTIITIKQHWTIDEVSKYLNDLDTNYYIEFTNYAPQIINPEAIQHINVQQDLSNAFKLINVELAPYSQSPDNYENQFNDLIKKHKILRTYSEPFTNKLIITDNNTFYKLYNYEFLYLVNDNPNDPKIFNNPNWLILYSK